MKKVKNRDVKNGHTDDIYRVASVSERFQISKGKFEINRTILTCLDLRE